MPRVAIYNTGISINFEESILHKSILCLENNHIIQMIYGINPYLTFCL